MINYFHSNLKINTLTTKSPCIVWRKRSTRTSIKWKFMGKSAVARDLLTLLWTIIQKLHQFVWRNMAEHLDWNLTPFNCLSRYQLQHVTYLPSKFLLFVDFSKKYLHTKICLSLTVPPPSMYNIYHIRVNFFNYYFLKLK